MKKVGNAQSGTLLVEMTDAAFNFKADITDAQAEQIHKGLRSDKRRGRCVGIWYNIGRKAERYG